MGIEAAFIASAVLQVASGFVSYAQQKKADKAAKQAAFEQAKLLEEDAQRAALEERLEAERARKRQRLAFLSSGVELAGSPLLVMEETRAKGEENAKNIIESAAAKANLLKKQGSIGTASFLGTAANTAQGLGTTYSNYVTVNKQIK